MFGSIIIKIIKDTSFVSLHMLWINGKILLSLLTEKYLGDIDFSPLGTSAGNQTSPASSVFVGILPN